MTRVGRNADAWKNTLGYRCPRCKSTRLFKDGFVHKRQRYRCAKCDTVTILPVGMKRQSKKGGQG